MGTSIICDEFSQILNITFRYGVSGKPFSVSMDPWAKSMLLVVLNQMLISFT